jgi:Glutamate synthase domain 2
MCSTCSDQCIGSCEIGLSAIRGSEAAYPYGTTNQQFASRKKYPFDFSHFNINGRVFGAIGADENAERTNVFSANTYCEIGDTTKIRCKAPILLPAMAKLNWKDYYSGAAMAGVIAVIGESAVKNDACLEYASNGKISNSPLLSEMIEYFRKYEHGYGDIVLQVNADDIAVGVPEFALRSGNLDTLEIKFGQAAKGIQHVAPVTTYEEALRLKKNGYLVLPDPLDEEVIHQYGEGSGRYFTQYGRLPMWNEETLSNMIHKYRELGAKNIFFKMAGYDEEDIRRVLKIASENHIALVTFDGAGGGTGHSPCTMMNEWGYPVIDLEQKVHHAMEQLRLENKWLPGIAMAGGIAMEDDIFKVLALGAPYVKLAGVGRAAMAAAMSARTIGTMISKGTIPSSLKCFGEETDDIFREAKALKNIYGNDITTGAVGVYSFINRLSFGIQLFMTLSRKFELTYINQRDVIPLTNEAKTYLKNITTSSDSVQK